MELVEQKVSLYMNGFTSSHDIAFNSVSFSSSSHGDNESTMGLTTPSSTQPSSPSASPALSLIDDRKQNKSESFWFVYNFFSIA